MSNTKKTLKAIIYSLNSVLLVHFRYLILFPGAAIENGRTLYELSKRNKEEFLKEKFNISEKIAKNLIIKKNYVLYEKDPNQKKEKQKTLVVFYGNAASINDILSDFKDKACLKKYKEYQNLMFINYPSNAYSQNKVINYGYDAIKDLIGRGYKSGNIDVMGHSIGGAVSAKVLRKLKKEDGINVGNYVNVNSFSKIPKTLPFASESLREGFIRKAISALSSVLFVGFSLNAAEAINDQGDFAARNTTVIRTKGDEIIDQYASLSKEITNKAVTIKVEIKDGEDPHNEINITEIQKILRTNNNKLPS